MSEEEDSTTSRKTGYLCRDFTSTETKMFRGGIRHYPEYNEKLIYGTRDTPMAYHDKIDYERGLIIHSRSNSNQFINFHYMYGGFKTYFWDRWFMNHWYRRNLRNAWLPIVLCYLCKLLSQLSRCIHHEALRQCCLRLLLFLRLIYCPKLTTDKLSS